MIVSFKLSVKRWLRAVIIVLSASIFVGITVYISGNLIGFCWKRFSILDKGQKIEIAVRYVMRYYPPVIDLLQEKNGDEVYYTRGRPDRSIAYSSFEDFLRQNPNCCYITDTGFENSQIDFISRAFGSGSEFVNVNYKVKYFDLNGALVAKNNEVYVAITNCGRPWSGI